MPMMMSEIAADDAGRNVRAERAQATRELILTAAERLFAERGVHAVADRQISRACAVRPVTGPLDSLGSPGWYARFMTQVTVAPALRTPASRVLDAESPSLPRLRDEVAGGLVDAIVALWRAPVTTDVRGAATGAP